MLSWKPLCHALLFGCISLVIGCGGDPSINKPATDSQSDTFSPVAVSPVTDSLPPVSEPNTTDNTTVPSSSVTAQKDLVNVSGRVTFDRVPFKGNGLDYSNQITSPARAVTVQAVDASNGLITSTTTDADGRYQLNVAQDQAIRVRVLAEMTAPGPSDWSVVVADNTQGNALYVLEGSLVSSGAEESQTRDLHASSGWEGDGYGSARAAAPFAVLDSLYDGFALLDEAIPGTVLPPLYVYWSPKNVSIGGNASEGHIGTSYYTSNGPSIYLLGAENNDTDEYDRAVIQHEFGHYIEHQLGRSESLGGSHSQRSKLDMRVAFGEAWGNAFAGMAGDDPVYRDSMRSEQQFGFSIDVERRGFGDQGWFSEASLQAILYDLFDDKDDGLDAISLGFAPILDALTSEEYLSFDGFASIYSFADTLKQRQPQAAEAIAAMLQSFSIYGQGGYGDGERNDGDYPIALPLYHPLTVNQTVNVCSDSASQSYNGMDVRRFIRLDLPEARRYTFTAQKTSGDLRRGNPQMRLFKQGSHLQSMLSGTVGFEQGERTLEPGQYILEVYEQANVSGDSSASGLACFDVSVR